MNNSLFKDTVRTISRTSSRFFSIVAIVALGISFFAGMNATAPDMLDTAEKYYIDSNATDLRIISTAGLTDDDIEVLKTIQGIEQISGEKYVDGKVKVNGEDLSDIDGSQLTVRVMSLDTKKAIAAENGEDDRTYINRPQLIAGNWPTAENQCVVDQSTLSTPEEFQIGSVITVEGENADISASLKNTEYVITGIIRTPVFMSYERGATSIGTGKLGTFIYAPVENFTADYYSSALIKLAGSADHDPYSEEYDKFVAPYTEFIGSIADERLASRVEPLKAEYSRKVADGEKEYAETKVAVEKQIAEGEQQVETILDMAQNGDAKLAEYKAQYNEKATEAGNAIDENKLEHSEQYAKWEEKRNEYNEAKALVEKYSTAETDYKNAVTQYNVAKTQVTTFSATVSYLENLVATTRSAVDQLDQSQSNSVGDIINRFETSGLVGAEVDEIMAQINSLTAVGTAEEMAAYLEPQLQTLEEKLAATKADLAQANTELADKKAELDEAAKLVEKLKEVKASLAGAEEELAAAEKELTSAGYDIQLGELEVLSQLSDLKNQITNYETNLQLAKAKAPTVQQEFEEAKAQALSKLESAKTRLQDANNFLLGLDDAKWYVQDRDEALTGYAEYKAMADRTRALSLIFPWFFFIVAALVCLNTMSRMIEDERTQLGTLKALGFTEKEIVKKYIVYAFIASFFGSIAGTFLGFAVFPTAITSAFSIMFDMPPVIIKYQLKYAVIGILLSILTTVGASYFSSRASLRTPASALMRPKAPKIGKRIFLEKFPKLWSKLSFTTKVTMRNVFRNKKRFIMAVIGVMGCTSLLVASFGLNNSIETAFDKQFTDEDSVVCYDMQVILNGSFDPTITECKPLTIVNEQSEVGTSMLNYMKVYNSTSAFSDEKMETYLFVPEDSNAVSDYMRLRDSMTGESLILPSNGAVITQKLAKKLNVGVGDSVTIKLDDRPVNIPVAAIAENYTFHYLFMSKEVYASLFGSNPRYNYIMANFATNVSDQQKAELSARLIDNYEISSVAFSTDVQTMFENVLNSLNFISLIMMICAALLAFIVLYNLSTINIHERIKEIATIKVLGFTKAETSAYIFRENLMLTVIGTFIGLFTGIGLHRMVIAVSEVDVIMFGRSIGVMGFILSAVLSVGFSLIVNLVLKRTLNRVKMVESLKSIE
ncbi:MAG: ABC transporter permease [Oscillospiraceae bacterium]|nr:ABC transporter permease [Oscillospiraceae bacterium]